MSVFPELYVMSVWEREEVYKSAVNPYLEAELLDPHVGDMPFLGMRLVRAFPNVHGDVVIQDEENRPMSPSRRIAEVHDIRFMPYTTGGHGYAISNEG